MGPQRIVERLVRRCRMRDKEKRPLVVQVVALTYFSLPDFLESFGYYSVILDHSTLIVRSGILGSDSW